MHGVGLQENNSKSYHKAKSLGSALAPVVNERPEAEDVTGVRFGNFDDTYVHPVRRHYHQTSNMTIGQQPLVYDGEIFPHRRHYPMTESLGGFGLGHDATPSPRGQFERPEEVPVAGVQSHRAVQSFKTNIYSQQKATFTAEHHPPNWRRGRGVVPTSDGAASGFKPVEFRRRAKDDEAASNLWGARKYDGVSLGTLRKTSGTVSGAGLPSSGQYADEANPGIIRTKQPEDQRTFNSMGVGASMSMADYSEGQANKHDSAGLEHRPGAPIWATTSAASPAPENSASVSSNPRQQGRSLADLFRADPGSSPTNQPNASATKNDEFSGQGALFRSQGPAWKPERATHLGANDTFRSDLSAAMQHPTSSDSYESSIGARAGQVARFHQGATQDGDEEAFNEDLAGVPAERTRQAPLLRVPWYRASTANDSGRLRC